MREISNLIQKEHNSNWPQIPDHPCRILIIGGTGYWIWKKNPYLI